MEKIKNFLECLLEDVLTPIFLIVGLVAFGFVIGVTVMAFV